MRESKFFYYYYLPFQIVYYNVDNIILKNPNELKCTERENPVKKVKQ